MDYCFFSMFSDGVPCLHGVTVDFAYTYRSTLVIDDAHDVVFLKFSFNAGDSDGKNADCLVGVQHFGSLFVNMYLSLSETFAVSYPFLDTRYGLGCGDKTSANRLFGMLYEVDEDVVAFAIGNNYCNTFICHFAGNVGLVSMPPLPKLDLLV